MSDRINEFRLVFRSAACLVVATAASIIFLCSTANADSAVTLDQTYNLHVHDGGFFTNANSQSLNEKYLRGTDSGTNGGWYYILPDGSLYSWGGSIATSQKVAQLDPSYYEDPFLLTEAALRNTEQPTPVSLAKEYEFSYCPTEFYTNHRGFGEKYFRGKDTNGQGGWYYVLPNGTVYIWGGSMAASQPIAHYDSSYYDNPCKLTESVLTDSQQPSASALDQTYQFGVCPTNFYIGANSQGMGLNEKYIKGKDLGGIPGNANDGWYFILPSGDLYSWNGSIALSKPIARLDSSYYDDPCKLTEAAFNANPQPTAAAINDYYQFDACPLNFYTGANSQGLLNEKYIRGKVLGNNNSGWYFILPNGDLYSWNGSIASSKPIARLDTSYYDDPCKLTEADYDPTSVMSSVTTTTVTTTTITTTTTIEVTADNSGGSNSSTSNTTTGFGIAGNPEDFSGSVSPTPNPTSFPTPLPSATPTPLSTPSPSPTPPPPPLCIDGEERVVDGRTVCVPNNCLSEPRFWLYINCDTAGVCTCEDGCEVEPVYEVSIQQVFGGSADNRSYGRQTSTYRSLATGDYPNCLTQIASECGNRWSTETNIWFLAGGRVYDDYLGYRGDRYIRNNFLGVPREMYGLGTDECVVQAIGGNTSVPSMSLLLNSECRPSVQPYSCGHQSSIYYDPAYGVADSPISLILDPRHKIGDAVNVVQFPLNPNKTNKWYAWKASANTPLVVFDPEHKGKITSASQLFGTYTFGKSWKHGFEALATLDTNKDGKLSGAELDVLGIWFDKNQDGISQDGEVVEITKAGITALYFTPDHEIKDGEDVYVTHGFERTVDGKSTSGTAVDWFVAEYQSRAEGLVKEQARVAKEAIEELSIPHSSSQELQRTDTWENRSSARKTTPSISGAWTWKTAETNINGELLTLGKDETAPMGLLTFTENNGELKGHSFIEINKPKNRNSIKSEVIMISLKGQANTTKDGVTKLIFTVKGDNGLETTSEAELSSDGRFLIGKSKMQIGRKPTGEPVLIDYLWKGERVK